jgi:hypothetical protein
MPIDSNERGAIARSVSKVLVAQSWVSGILAFAIILSAVSIPLYGLYKGDEDIETPEVIKNWGGVVIGFYFGSAITQMASLVNALQGKNEDNS